MYRYDGRRLLRSGKDIHTVETPGSPGSAEEEESQEAKTAREDAERVRDMAAGGLPMIIDQRWTYGELKAQVRCSSASSMLPA